MGLKGEKAPEKSERLRTFARIARMVYASIAPEKSILPGPYAVLRLNLSEHPADFQAEIPIEMSDLHRPGTGSEQGRRERELAAVKALTCAFEQEVRRAGYRSLAQFHRSCGSGR